MSRGERVRCTIQPKLAHGGRGVHSYVPKNAVMNFDIELITFEDFRPPKQSELYIKDDPKKKGRPKAA
jgi:hypothetical protein